MNINTKCVTYREREKKPCEQLLTGQHLLELKSRQWSAKHFHVIIYEDIYLNS